jgi:hypothetical protein
MIHGVRRNDKLIKYLEPYFIRRSEYEELLGMNKGWIGGAWQKDPLRLGFSAQRLINASDTALGAGANDVDSGSVAAGELWVITNIAVRYAGTVAGVVLTPGFYDGSNLFPVGEERSITSGQWYAYQGEWILVEDDVLRLQVAGATLNDDAYIRASGFRVDIDQ